jgi:molybdopterin-binding protein
MNLFSTSVDKASAAELELKEGSTALIQAQEAQGKSVRKTAQDFIDASEMKIAALKLEVEALIKVGEAQKQFIRSFDSSGEKWYNKGLDEWFARFVAGAKQANDSTGGQTAPIISQIDEIQKRVDKLRAIQNRPDVKFTIDEDGKLDRAGRALRDASQEIERIQQLTTKMNEGPGAFEFFEKQFADTKKIQEFKDRLMDAGVAVGTVNEKVAAYTAALAVHQKTQEGTFAAMKAMSDGFRDATVGAFNSVADAIGNAVAKGELNSQTFIDIVDKMVAEIISMILKLAVINPILNSIFNPATPMPAFGGGGTGGLGSGIGNSIMSIFGFAKGGAFSGGVRMMAKGGILNGPTMFGTRSGPAMGGEAGDEAVMPLVRSSSGHLGVRGVGGGSGGGGGGTTINVITPPGSKTEQRQRKGANGDIVDLVISEVNKATAGGKMDRGNNARFGARPKLAPIS